MTKNWFYQVTEEGKQAMAFYNSKAWRRCRELVLKRDHYLCQECLKEQRLTPANIVHHIVHYRDDPSKGLDMDNLITVCPECHNKLHPEKSGGKKIEKKQPKINVYEPPKNPDIW